LDSARDTSKKERVVIGWNEYIDFPEWKITGLKAKVDTGARTSALHVDNIAEVSRGRVRFDVILHRKFTDRRVTIEVPVVRRAYVTSSSGTRETRYFVNACIRLGSIEKLIEVSLASRGPMLFRMLLGRKALEKDFLIDVGHRALATVRPLRKKKKKAKVAR
jgi:hypothetical protein